MKRPKHRLAASWPTRATPATEPAAEVKSTPRRKNRKRRSDFGVPRKPNSRLAKATNGANPTGQLIVDHDMVQRTTAALALAARETGLSVTITQVERLILAMAVRGISLRVL